jgi:hypothetical protein
LAIWMTGVPEPHMYHGGGSRNWNVLKAIGRGFAVSVGVADYVTVECEGTHEWDPHFGQPLAQRRISSRCRFAQDQAWSAWYETAPDAVREIADALARRWTLGRAALAETAEILAGAHHEPTPCAGRRGHQSQVRSPLLLLRAAITRGR